MLAVSECYDSPQRVAWRSFPPPLGKRRLNEKPGIIRSSFDKGTSELITSGQCPTSPRCAGYWARLDLIGAGPFRIGTANSRIDHCRCGKEQANSMTSPIMGALLVAQSVSLLVTAATWWRVWQCPCEGMLQDAAFWTALTVAQNVVLIGLSVLKPR